MSVGLIVGSGFRRLGLEVLDERLVETPYGRPSGPLLTIGVGERHVLAFARHGPDHGLAPHAVNYRANVWALHEAGVDQCIATNAVGTIAPGFSPGDLAVPDQLIDYTSGRECSFGGPGGGGVVHAEFTEPFDPVLRGRLATAVAECGYTVHAGVYGITSISTCTPSRRNASTCSFTKIPR
jgi:purine nucleoside phosphorylase